MQADITYSDAIVTDWSDELSCLLGQIMPSSNKSTLPSSNLPKRTRNFVGRKDFINSIETAYSEEDKKKTIVLNSYAGTGKTTLANEFGYRFKSKQSSTHSIVYWIKSDKSNADSAFQNLASEINHLSEKQKNDKVFVMRQIKNRLFASDANFLFIFDNCDSYDAIDDYVTTLTDLENTQILITTRDSNFIQNLNEETSVQINLEPFEADESVEYLFQNLKDKVNKNKEKIKDLVDLFEMTAQKIRPYILNKLIAFVRLKLAPFMSSFDAMCLELKSQQNKEYKNEIIGADIFDSLIEKKKKSWDILKYSSFLDPDFIPIELYEQLFQINLNEFTDAIAFLRELSLLNYDETEKGFKIHRSLQSEIKIYLNTKSPEENLINKLIAKLMETISNQKINKWNSQKYIVHFKNVIDIHLDDNKNACCCQKAKTALTFGEYLRKTSVNLKESFFYFNNALDIYEKLYPNDEHSDIALTLKNMGLVLDYQGKYDEALVNLKKSLDIYQKVCGKEAHYDVADNLSHIGSVLSNQEKYDESLDYFQKALEIFQQKVNSLEENTDVAMTLNNIGYAFRDLEKYDDALAYFKRSLECYVKAYGTEEHSDIAMALNNIGNVYREQRKYDDALDMYQKSLDIKKKCYGTEEHSDVAITLNNIGIVLRQKGEHENALPFYHKSLAIKKKVDGVEEHSEVVARTLKNIGFNLRRHFISFNQYYTDEHSFIRFKNEKNDCNGYFYFGNCVCKQTNKMKTTDYYKCTKCENFNMCSHCFDVLNNGKLTSPNHAHPFYDYFILNSWTCDGCGKDTDGSQSRFKCSICPDFDFCSECLLN